MTSVPASILEETLESWRFARQGVIDELRNLPSTRMDFRPTPDMRSVRDLAQHIVEVAMIFTGELARPDTDFHRTSWQGLTRMYGARAKKAKTQAQLVALLKSQLREGEKLFRARGDLALLQLIKRFDGQPWTRLTMLHHAIAHEEYHRAQLAVYARLLGIVPALTKQIHGG